MENQHSKIDEIFRQRLHDAEAPPPPFVWPAVEKELRKQRRQVLFFWIFGGSVLLGSAALVLQLAIGKPAKTAENLAPVAEMSKPETSHNPTVSNAGAASSAQSYTADAEALQKEQIGAVDKVNAGAKRGSRISASDSRKYGRDVQGSDQKDAIAARQQAAELDKLEEFLTVSDASSGLEDLVHSKISDAGIVLKMNEQPPLSSLEQKAQVKLTKPIKSFSRRKKTQPKVCYDFASHPRAWLVDVYAGPSFAQRSLTSRLDDEPYLNQRLATESRSSAVSAGIRTSLMFNRNLLVRTGLHYDQVTEVFEFIDPTSIIYLLKYTPGNPVPDTLGVQYGENYLKTYNRYAMLDIPLMIGVEMRRGRSGFNMNAGLSANLLFRKSGVIIDPNTHEPARIGAIPQDPKAPGPKTSLSQDVFHTNLGLSATASVQWYWYVAPSFRLFVEPSFRQMLRPITLPDHPVDQRYSILSLRLGASKIF